MHLVSCNASSRCGAFVAPNSQIHSCSALSQTFKLADDPLNFQPNLGGNNIGENYFLQIWGHLNVTTSLMVNHNSICVCRQAGEETPPLHNADSHQQQHTRFFSGNF